MHIKLTLLTNNKQDVWLIILEFLRENDCHLITQHIVEKGDQRIITVVLETKNRLTSQNLDQLKKLSDDILFVSTKIEENPSTYSENLESNEIKHQQENSSQPGINPLIFITIATIAILFIGIYLVTQPEETPVQNAKADSLQQSTIIQRINSDKSTSASSEQITLEQKQFSLTPSTNQAHPESSIKAELIDKEKSQIKIESLLLTAKKDLDSNTLTKNLIDHAFQQIKAILIVDPNNEQTKPVLGNIVKAYISLSDQALTTNDFNLAEQYLKTASDVLPHHAAIQEARKRLQIFQTQQTELRHKKQIAQLLKKAIDDIQASHFSKPEKNNAIARYQQVLSLDPNNTEAKQGLITIAKHYIRLVKKAIAKQDWKQAEVFLLHASKLDPNKVIYNLYQQKIITAKTEQSLQISEKQQANTINQLLLNAAKYFQASQLHYPKNQNALAKYQAVLALQADNKKALAGIQNIVLADLNLASLAISESQLVVAENYIKQAEKLSTEAEQIKAIKLRLDQAKSTEKKPEPNQSKTTQNKQTNNVPNQIPSSQIVVIVHPSNTLSNISSKLLKNIYRGQVSNWSSGEKIKAINQTIDSASRAVFYKKILNTTPETTFKKSKQYFGTTELSAFKPTVKKSDQAVKKVIRRNKRSIGYISLNNVDDTVKALDIDGLKALSNGYILN